MNPTRICVAALLLVLLVVARFALAQQPTDDQVLSRLGAKASRFLDDLGGEDQQSAFDNLLQGSQIASQAESLKSLVDKTKELQTRYGRFEASERIVAKRVGKDLVQLRYLYKCHNFPVVWYFTYYRDFSNAAAAADNWVLIGLRFDTQLEQL